MRIHSFSERLEEFNKKVLINKFILEPTITQLKTHVKPEKYEVPINEIEIWIENGWTFN